MRKMLALALCLALLCGILCGCAQELPQSTTKATASLNLSGPITATEAPTEATEPTEPPCDPTPMPCALAVTVGGQPLSGAYGTADAPLLSLAELQPLLAAQASTTLEDNRYVCTLLVDGVQAVLHSGETAAMLSGAQTQLSCAPVYDGADWYLPAELLSDWLGYSQFDDSEENHRYYTALPDMAQIPEGYTVPVLMYHAVSDECWGIAELFVSPSSMEEQLKYLTENGYTPIWFEDLPHVAEYEKPVILTFDDGYDDNYTELFPLLQKYNVKATIFCIAGALGTSHKMTAEQIKEMSDSGLVSIQSHTMTHPDLSQLSADQLEYELGQSKLELLRLTGKEPFVLCYPTGYHSNTSIEITQKYYSFGLLMGGGSYATGDDPYLIYRQYISRYTGLDSFAAKVN